MYRCAITGEPIDRTKTLHEKTRRMVGRYWQGKAEPFERMFVELIYVNTLQGYRLVTAWHPLEWLR